jgi:hypothetical protein
MPAVHREAGYGFYFHAEEGTEPPHVCVDKGDARPSCGSILFDGRGLRVGK